MTIERKCSLCNQATSGRVQLAAKVERGPSTIALCEECMWRWPSSCSSAPRTAPAPVHEGGDFGEGVDVGAGG